MTREGVSMGRSQIGKAVSSALLAVLCASTPLRADRDGGSGGRGDRDDGPKARAAPATNLGTGAVGIMVLAAGCIIAYRRKRL